MRNKTTHEYLNLGCGKRIYEGFQNLDIYTFPGVDNTHDLRKFPWPFGTNRLKGIAAFNVLEYLPDFVRTMEEIWRISQNNAEVIIRVPFWNSSSSYTDPNIVSRFDFDTFKYFDVDSIERHKYHYYTFCNFVVKECAYYTTKDIDTGIYTRSGIRNKFLRYLLRRISYIFPNIVHHVEFKLLVVK